MITSLTTALCVEFRDSVATFKDASSATITVPAEMLAPPSETSRPMSDSCQQAVAQVSVATVLDVPGGTVFAIEPALGVRVARTVRVE